MGIIIALVIITLWSLHLAFSLAFVSIDFSNPMLYLHIIIQAYLYTGLFITGHDAMHGTVSPKNKNLNNVIGFISVFLFAGMSYRKLLANHKLHHNFPATESDPDYNVSSQNFFVWWSKFMWRYLTFSQILIMAIAFNILKYLGDFSDLSILLLWVLPAILSTLQLFYFGTFLPHKLPHISEMGIHKARTQNKNHLWAMISCYFFGYHLEHHVSPSTPWWQLYKTK